MKLRDVTRTYGGTVTHLWPPQLLVQIGPMIVQPGEGVLKSVKRFGNRLSLTVEQEGQEAWDGVDVQQDQRPSLAAVEKASVGKAIEAIGDIVAGVEFSDPKFHPVWAKAEELGVPLFIHPLSTPELAKRFAGNGWLSNTIGNPLSTTIALSHLIFEGTFDRFPGLKVIAAHGGGYLPSYAMRGDRACFVSPSNCDPSIQLKKKPSE